MSISGNNILAGASGSQQYEIQRSIRINDDDDAFLERTPSSAGNRRTFTWSAWLKRSSALGSDQQFFTAAPTGHASDTAISYLGFNTSDQISFFNYWSSAVRGQLTTNARFRDVSAWYHIVLRVDTTEATADNRFRLYVNGTEQTSFSARSNPAQNLELYFNSTVEHKIGEEAVRDRYNFDGYMAEVNFVDGTALGPSNFGETDAVTGAWIPKQYSGSYGSQGWYLKFADNSGVTATTLGKDSSGNGNNWTPNNFSVTAGAGNDSLEDTPTNNWCTFNFLKKGTITVSEGNLKAVGGADYQGIHGTIGLPSTGKFYWEATVNATSGAVTDQFIGVAGNDTVVSGTSPYPQSDTPALYYVGTGSLMKNGTTNVQTGLGTFSANDVIGVAYDADASTVQFYKNGSAVGTAESLPSTTETLFPAYIATTNRFANFNWGQRSFDQTPPTGFEALNTANLPVPTIKNGTEYFNTVLYTGNGSTQTISGVGFQPDWVWLKARSQSYDHAVFDVIRGATKDLEPNQTSVEQTRQMLTAFTSDGFSLGNDTQANQSSNTYVAWNWKAGGSGSANTDGTISSTVSVNADAGFSIGTFSGTGSAGTIGHGLGISPKWILIKNRDSSNSWAVYHDAVGANKQLLLNSSNAASNDTNGFPSAPTSTVINVGTGASMDTNQSGSHVFLAFAEVESYSKFGSYTGNGSSDGPFVFTGFRPSFLIVKRTDANGYDWEIYDSVRGTYNVIGPRVWANLSSAETSNTRVDFLSNGFKLRSSGGQVNGGTITFVAFAQTPFKYANAV